MPDPASDFTFPLNGRYQGADFVAIDQNFPMPITGINIPFNLFELRGTFNANGIATRPAAFASTNTLSIPTFGPYLVIAGLANDWYKEMLVAGTYVTRPYDGNANHVPNGIHVANVAYIAQTKDTSGSVIATFTLDPGTTYPATDHRAGILLVDPSTQKAVYMDYKGNLSTTTDAAGNVQSVRLMLPQGMTLPGQLQAYVMLDVFPVYHKVLK